MYFLNEKNDIITKNPAAWKEQQNFPNKKKMVVKNQPQLNISPVESIKIVHPIC